MIEPTDSALPKDKDHDINMQDVFQLFTEKSLSFIKNFEHHPEQLLKTAEQWFDFSLDYMEFAGTLLNNPYPIQQMYTAYWQDVVGLFQEQIQYGLKGKIMPIADKRFSADEWVKNPFFNLLSQQYLLAKEHITSLLEHLEFRDERAAKRMKFFTRQYLDALSPDNFLQTNPQLMAETLQSHGRNLLLGLQNLLTDMEAGPSRLIISLTDKNAFKIGENIAITPGKVIYRNDLIELIQYTPQTPKVKSVPLLIIPPWINKYYILDLSASNSMVHWLVGQGITVFMISWINPDSSYAHKGIADYLIDGPLAAIKTIQTQLQVSKVNAVGFCIGGTLLAMLLAYNKARGDTSVNSATFLASLIDFSDPGDIAVFIDEKQVKKIEKQMQEKGYFEGHSMASAFNSLRASDLVWAYFIRNYLHGKPPVPFDILFWNTDTTNMAAKMHSQYLRWMYLNNDLIKPGKIKINKVPIDVSQIDIPTFFVSTKKDHIAPWQTTYKGFQLMKGNKQFLLGGSGHIAGIVIPPGGEKYGYYLNPAHPKNPTTWLENAHYHKGSWWPEWLSWLNKKSGRQIPAPVFSKLPLEAHMDAPGSYVFKPSKLVEN